MSIAFAELILVHVSDYEQFAYSWVLM